MMKRPTLNHAMKVTAAKRLGEQISNVTTEEIAACLYEDMDGFAIAKLLENVWECRLDFKDTEVLNQMSLYASYALREAEKQWVIDFDIKPPHPVGTMTTIGVIDGICQYSPACYLIKPYCQNDEIFENQRWLVKFEDAVPSGIVAA
ncbi:hypothetical protein [Shewanella glacialimarina]|uniref:hypothetical protein n=1 Tax=Shewanella glacialimarina TaxID=2590884 RepID=UPI001CF8ABF0|nr:hypothetical protein [Shewanella glacialimarina]UCX03542.1 hypothetical protein FJ709_02800 [Shewanella glacialimarina]